MRAWIRALHIRERYIRQWLEERDELLERMHRLEITHRELKDRLDHQEELLERERNRRVGGLGGRPRKLQEPQNALETIPTGDKASLREHARRAGLLK